MDPEAASALTIEDLALATGTTTRRIRSLQTLGLVPHPSLHGRTGLYEARHQVRLEVVLHLQQQRFSLESLVVLFDALEAGRSLAAVLGVAETAAPAGDAAEDGTDSAELYGFAELQPTSAGPRRTRTLLSLVPTTVWGESQAS